MTSLGKPITQRQLRVGEMIKQSLSMIFLRNEAKVPNLETNISINSYQWEFLWESIPTLGISKRTNFQNWEQTFQSIPTSGNAQIPYKKPCPQGLEVGAQSAPPF